MNTHPEERGVIPQRRLPCYFHTTRPTLWQPFVNGTQQIMGNYGRIPAIGKAAYSPVGNIPTVLSPDQKPLSATQFSWGWRQLQLTVFYQLLP
jgi:hypothetical protein